MNKIKFMLLITLLLFVSGCGTYSVIRPADNLKQGEFEINAGVALNQVNVGVVVGQINVGIVDWLEIGTQYEVYSAFGWLRFALLNSEKHGIAMALGIGGGMGSTFTSIALSDENDIYFKYKGAMLGSFTIGRRWNWFELYLGYRIIPIFLDPKIYLINTAKLGIRFTIAKHLLITLEGGATFHHDFLILGEGAISLGIKF